MRVRSETLRELPRDYAEVVLRTWLAATDPAPATGLRRCGRCGEMFSFRVRQPPQPIYCEACVR